MPDPRLTRWNHLAAELARARQGVNPLALCAPLNRATESAAVAHAHRLGRRYQPRFRYQPGDPGVIERLETFARGCADTDPWSASLADTATGLARLLRALGTGEPDALTTASAAYWAPLEPATIDAATARLAAAADPSVTDSSTDAGLVTHDAAWLVANLEATLVPAGFADWSVTLADALGARVAVLGAERLIKVRADARFVPSDLRRMLAHELAGHAVRAVNGALQPLTLLGMPRIGYLPTEEGLAVHLEHRYGAATPDQGRVFALRALTVSLACESSFADTYLALREHCGHPEAFELCVRAKRGLADQAAPGALVRDHCYLQGRLAVDAHLGAHPEDLELLVATKCSLAELPALRVLDAAGLVAAPHLTPDAVLRVLDA